MDAKKTPQGATIERDFTTKTDAADAYVLGAIPMFGGVPSDPVYVPNAERHALQRLTRQRERLEDEVTAIKRRLADLDLDALAAVDPPRGYGRD